MSDPGAVVDGLAIALLAVALFSVTIRGLVAGVWLLVVQSGLLALVAAAIALWSGAAHMWAASLLTVTVRAVAVPAVLLWILRAVALRRETRPLLSTRYALILAVALTLVAFFAAGRLQLSDAFPAHDALQVSLALIFIGLLLMITRRKAVSQLIGLITIENGIFLAGLIATLGMPLFVEIGIFFDLLVAVGVTAVLTLRINEHFDTMNTDQLRRLRG
jgi:hydrogenase-4 membrane subunit HyfE